MMVQRFLPGGSLCRWTYCAIAGRIRAVGKLRGGAVDFVLREWASL